MINIHYNALIKQPSEGNCVAHFDIDKENNNNNNAILNISWKIHMEYSNVLSGKKAIDLNTSVDLTKIDAIKLIIFNKPYELNDVDEFFKHINDCVDEISIIVCVSNEIKIKNLEQQLKISMEKINCLEHYVNILIKNKRMTESKITSYVEKKIIFLASDRYKSDEQKINALNDSIDFGANAYNLEDCIMFDNINSMIKLDTFCFDFGKEPQKIHINKWINSLSNTINKCPKVKYLLIYNINNLDHVILLLEKCKNIKMIEIENNNTVTKYAIEYFEIFCKKNGIKLNYIFN